MKHTTRLFSILSVFVVVLTFAAGAACAADIVKGQVLGRGAPIANSTVTLWAA
jgi:hypothetical protein